MAAEKGMRGPATAAPTNRSTAVATPRRGCSEARPMSRSHAPGGGAPGGDGDGSCAAGAPLYSITWFLDHGPLVATVIEPHGDVLCTGSRLARCRLLVVRAGEQRRVVAREGRAGVGRADAA